MVVSVEKKKSSVSFPVGSRDMIGRIGRFDAYVHATREYKRRSHGRLRVYRFAEAAISPAKLFHQFLGLWQPCSLAARPAALPGSAGRKDSVKRRVRAQAAN
jgi:hypothetical protein